MNQRSKIFPDIHIVEKVITAVLASYLCFFINEAAGVDKANCLQY